MCGYTKENNNMQSSASYIQLRLEVGGTGQKKLMSEFHTHHQLILNLSIFLGKMCMPQKKKGKKMKIGLLTAIYVWCASYRSSELKKNHVGL